MAAEITNKRALEIEAEDLERLSVKLIQDQNWQVLEKMLAPGCQFVSSQGACDKESAMRLMKEMHLGPVQFKDFKVTEAGDNLIISFWIAALEYRDGKELSPEYSPRLSVWKKMDSRWQCIAYADLIASK
jgi:cytosine/adenosine deaminase-related metal-dependent hydrolase